MPSQFHGGNDPFPVGAIIPWWGDPDDIPYGWEYCDGTDGTPDLTNRFPRGVPDSLTDPGATGGENHYAMTVAQMPAHNHDGETDPDGEHYHWTSTYSDTYVLSDDFPQGVEHQKEKVESTLGGGHTHTGHTVDSGGDERIDNRPEYVRMSFIQKQPNE